MYGGENDGNVNTNLNPNINIVFGSEVFFRGKSTEQPLSPEDKTKFESADCLFRGALISILADNIVDVYMHMSLRKDMWNALEVKFGVSDAGNELYVMEQFCDYKIKLMRFSRWQRNLMSSPRL